jgi:hypothetical protein
LAALSAAIVLMLCWLSLFCFAVLVHIASFFVVFLLRLLFCQFFFSSSRLPRLLMFMASWPSSPWYNTSPSNVFFSFECFLFSLCSSSVFLSCFFTFFMFFLFCFVPTHARSNLQMHGAKRNSNRPTTHHPNPKPQPSRFHPKNQIRDLNQHHSLPTTSRNTPHKATHM